MATVVKRGNSYKITVSCGFDGKGRRIRQHTTWTPSPGMTERQIEKELTRQTVLFEELVASGTNAVDGTIRFGAFVEVFLEWAGKNLKPHTVARYEAQLQKMCKGIGHIKLKDLKPGHIAKLFDNLCEAGIREHDMARIKIDILAWCKEHGTTRPKLRMAAGLSPKTSHKLLTREPIAKDRAEAFAAVMGVPFNSVFEVVPDLTPLKPSTVRSYHSTLSTALSHAVRWGYIQTNPAKGIELPSNAGYHAKYLDEPDTIQMLELLAEVPLKWRAVVTFDLLSGLRRAELLGLRWCDVDLDNQLIYVRQTWNYTPKKGCYIDTPKSRSSERPLKISRTAVVLLIEYKAWQDHQREIMGDAWEDMDGRVFTKEDGRPLFPDGITKWFSKFVKTTGISPVHIHSLRHTYASLLISDGTPLVVVAHNMGHAQPSTTSNIYAHVIASAEAKAAQVTDRFADLIGSTGTKVAPKPGESEKAG